MYFLTHLHQSVRMSLHSSQGVVRDHGVTESELALKLKLTSIRNRDKFLLSCIEEQVLPRSAPPHLHHSDKPFSNTAREYLREARETLRYEAEEIKSQLQHVHLPHNMVQKIKEEDRKQKDKLNKKLEHLCRDSRWNNIGREDLITNLSSHTLTQTQKEALALGLKFKTNINDKRLADYVGKNYHWQDSDIESGFKQGVLLCCKAATASNSYTIPRRYIHALTELRENSGIIITTADKGGGVVVMNKSDYVDKMNTLLSDVDTYTKQSEGEAEKEARSFNKEARKVMRRTEKGKQLLRLLEENPVIPRMRGLPKTHKPGVPMRPITSGIGSAPHRLAKHLAKPLTSALGKISDSHLKNSTDLMRKLREVNFSEKQIVSFDVKSLFTNVPINGAINAVNKVLEEISESELPLNKKDYLKLVEMCMNFGSFTFDSYTYRQHEGLPMGSPLSCVAACLFMESLESEHYCNIIPNGSKWYRYVDDCLVVLDKDTDLDMLLREMNNVHEKIQFTIEKESNNSLPFLDTVVIRAGNDVKFKVYRKPTNKDDFIHYQSAHDEKTKSGVIIGFYLRALRICSPEYVDEEIKYINESFGKLGYPKGMLALSLKKARSISARGEIREERDNVSYLVVPNSDLAQALRATLRPTGLVIVCDSGRKIGELVRPKIKGYGNDNSVVYKIPCGGCDKAYYGETYRGLEKRIKEHRADVRYHRTTSAFVNHIDQAGHLPKWEDAITLEKNVNRQSRKVLEAMHIAINKNINQRTGDLKWAKITAAVASRERIRKGG